MSSPFPPDAPSPSVSDSPDQPPQPADVPQPSPAAPSDTPFPGPDAPGDAPEPAQPDPEPAPAPGTDVSQHKVKLLDVTARVENFFANHPELDKGLMTELRSGVMALERFF